MRSPVLFLLAAACVLQPHLAAAQGLTGALIGTVKDAQGGVLPGAVVRVSSPALIGGPATLTTNEKGQLRFPALPPGPYVLDIEIQGFATYHEEDILIGAGATIERTAVLKLAGLAESVVVEGAGSRIEARDPGFGTRFGPEDLKAIPTRRSSMFDFIRAAPGVSPTSPASGTATTVSAFGSGTNENQFLIDGTNFTCPCNGVARAEPGVDFIQEVQVQSVGASAEFGNVQGAVINVVTRQGSERFLYDASYYGQTAGLTSQPVRRPDSRLRPDWQSGYERARYRDFTTNLGGPAVRDRLWFFAGYQYLRDYDSQPGTDPAFPRTYEQDKIFAKLTWQLAPGWQLVQSFHDEFWVNPELPTLVTPFEATTRSHASVPAMTFGHLTHTSSANTLWDVRVGRFVYSQRGRPEHRRSDDAEPVRPRDGCHERRSANRSADLTHHSHDRQGDPQPLPARAVGRRSPVEDGRAGRTGRAPRQLGHSDGCEVRRQQRTAVSGHLARSLQRRRRLPHGRRVRERRHHDGGPADDQRRTAIRPQPRHQSRTCTRSIPKGAKPTQIVDGLGTLYTWNVLSPRLGVTSEAHRRWPDDAARELREVQPGRADRRARRDSPRRDPDHDGRVRSGDRRLHDASSGGRSQNQPAARSGDARAAHGRVLHWRGSRDRSPARGGDRLRPQGRRATSSDGRMSAVSIARRRGRCPTAAAVPVFVLANSTAARRFLLTNPDGYSLTYNGLVMVVEKRRSDGWQAFGSYTFSRVSGCRPPAGAPRRARRSAPSPAPTQLTFGRDPNDLTNARGRLPNDRPHMFRVMGRVDVPRTGLVIAANLQHFSGKPWAATAQLSLPQGSQRVLLEPRGSRRLSSQSLLDLRVSRTFAFGGVGRIELLLDVLNALNDTAEEGLATDNLFSPNFGQPTVFMDPRRAMVGVRLNLGR